MIKKEVRPLPFRVISPPPPRSVMAVEFTQHSRDIVIDDRSFEVVAGFCSLMFRFAPVIPPARGCNDLEWEVPFLDAFGWFW